MINYNKLCGWDGACIINLEYSSSAQACFYAMDIGPSSGNSGNSHAVPHSFAYIHVSILPSRVTPDCDLIPPDGMQKRACSKTMVVDAVFNLISVHYQLS